MNQCIVTWVHVTCRHQAFCGMHLVGPPGIIHCIAYHPTPLHSTAAMDHSLVHIQNSTDPFFTFCLNVELLCTACSLKVFSLNQVCLHSLLDCVPSYSLSGGPKRICPSPPTPPLYLIASTQFLKLGKHPADFCQLQATEVY